MNNLLPSGGKLIQTIGHSTRTLEEFLTLIIKHEVTKIIDIRTIPRSRKNPQFNQETLPQQLNSSSINYFHMAGLGGLRHPVSNAPNSGWRNDSFRGFADYMQTTDFIFSLNQLIELSQSDRIALMCAEAVPWRCHRSLIADALTIRGIRVEHILSPTKSYLHSITDFAVIEGLKITYPPEKKSSGG